MTKEIIEGIRKIVVPFVKKRLFEINYEGLGESDAKEFDEHMNEILDLATKALEQEPIIDVNVPHKIAEFLSDWDGDENAKMEISVDDMREIAFVYTKKARIERQLKEKALEQEPCEDAISREDLISRMKSVRSHYYKNGKIDGYKNLPTEMKIRIDEVDYLIGQIEDAPPVTPQSKAGHWIPVKFRPLTDEEQKEYPDYCYMADCPMPDDGEEILVSTKYGRVEKDECGFDDGYYLDSGYDWQTDIVAWMPLPKPYEPEESEG